MKKYLILFVLIVFAGITINCVNRYVPQDSFRVKTRGKLYLSGISVPLSVPNPNISFNLRTTGATGSESTTGSVTEFYPNGVNASSDASGVFDAIDAVTPAIWSARIAPGQSQCSEPEANPFNFSATNGSIHKIECNWFVQINYSMEPSAVAVGGGHYPLGYVRAETLTGILVKGGGGSAYFKKFAPTDLKAQFYRETDDGDYVLDGEKPVTSVSTTGTTILIPVPDYTFNRGIVHYRILIKEIIEEGEVYVGHANLNVYYGTGRGCSDNGHVCDGM